MHEEAGGAIDLLLTDVIMPGYDGLELYRRLAATDPSLKVLLISGYAGKTLESRGQHELALPFMQKPFSSTELTRKVRQILDTASGLEPRPELREDLRTRQP